MPLRESRSLFGALLAALVVSAWAPRDTPTWFMEAAPVLIGLPLVLASREKFPFTPLLYRLLFAHALILLVGAHYTYAEVPAGAWVSAYFGSARNHYDRLGHFAQGFVPAILARELLLRRSSLVRGRWLFFLVCCVCLAFSACYELMEWAAAAVLGEDADAFLGTQGDPWDTQWDMFLALMGSIFSQLILSRRHDRELARL